MITLYAICFAYVWVHVLQIHYRLKINFKPFNCEVCLAGWFSFFGNIFTFSLFDSIGLMFVAMVGEILLVGLINKL